MTFRVALITGGSTPERRVALAGAGQVAAALRERGHHVSVVDTVFGCVDRDDEAAILLPHVGIDPPSREELAEWTRREMATRLGDLPPLRACDVAFLVLHGRQGEGGGVQAVLDLAGVCYTGSGQLGSALAMDKDLSKRLFRAAGIPTPDWAMWPASEAAVEHLGFPLVVKPSNVGSTVGLSVVHARDALQNAVDAALAFDDEVLLERYVPGREFTVGVLGDRALAVGEITPHHAVFDYECKYTPGMCDEVFPAEIPDSLARRLQALALSAHMALKLRDLSRIDFKVTPDGEPSCLEANTLPGLTATSLLPQSAAAAGLGFGDLCDEICRRAVARCRAGNILGAQGD